MGKSWCIILVKTLEREIKGLEIGHGDFKVAEHLAIVEEGIWPDYLHTIPPRSVAPIVREKRAQNRQSPVRQDRRSIPRGNEPSKF